MLVTNQPRFIRTANHRANPLSVNKTIHETPIPVVDISTVVGNKRERDFQKYRVDVGDVCRSLASERETPCDLVLVAKPFGDVFRRNVRKKSSRVTHKFRARASLLTPHRHRCSTCIRHIDTCVRVGRGEDAGANAQRIQILVRLCSTKATKRRVLSAVLFLVDAPTPRLEGRKSRVHETRRDERAHRGTRDEAQNRETRPEEQFLSEKRRSRAAWQEDVRSLAYSFGRSVGVAWRGIASRRVAFFVACPAEFFVGPTLPDHARNIFARHAHPSRFHATRLCVGPRVRERCGDGLVVWVTGQGCIGAYVRGRFSSLSFPTHTAVRGTHTSHGRYAVGDVHRREKNRWSWQERGYAREPFFFLTRALFEGFKGHGD